MMITQMALARRTFRPAFKSLGWITQALAVAAFIRTFSDSKPETRAVRGEPPRTVGTGSILAVDVVARFVPVTLMKPPILRLVEPAAFNTPLRAVICGAVAPPGVSGTTLKPEIVMM